MKYSRLLLVVTLLSQITTFAQSPCSQNTLYNQLDFWVGEWNVYDQNNQLVGTNTIEKILKDCAIMEHWTGGTGNQGKSLFYVDNNTTSWKQVWVTENSPQPWGQKEKSLIRSIADSLVVFQGSYQMNGSKTIDRTTLTKIDKDNVRQVIQVSQDGGSNWRTTFDAIYKRKD